MQNSIDTGLILRFGLKCLGIFALIFLAAVFTPRIAEYIDKWKAKYKKSSGTQAGRDYPVRSIYELPPEPEQKEPEHPRKKAVVRKKSDKK